VRTGESATYPLSQRTSPPAAPPDRQYQLLGRPTVRAARLAILLKQRRRRTSQRLQPCTSNSQYRASDDHRPQTGPSNRDDELAAGSAANRALMKPAQPVHATEPAIAQVMAWFRCLRLSRLHGAISIVDRTGYPCYRGSRVRQRIVLGVAAVPLVSAEWSRADAIECVRLVNAAAKTSSRCHVHLCYRRHAPSRARGVMPDGLAFRDE
jgi:hypothetical protein